ncbi:MAG: Acetyl-CoA acetyltransferase [Candidatus Anoxychlamydiales bacterium]|nr:Acetyl-CoA acetyltransferase [Candidatus Anoxychlamydiales bacterium]
MEEVVIVAARRSAIGKFLGTLKDMPASTLGSLVIKELLQKTKIDPNTIDEVILGQVLTAGVGQNPARQAAIEAGLPSKVPAFTINKVCGSGLKAIELGVNEILLKNADIIIAGGQENMSLSPHVLLGSRAGKRMGDWSLVDSMIKDGLFDAYNHCHMGVTAENVAEKYKISRKEQDSFAFESQMRSKKAIETNRFKEEIIPIKVPQRKKDPIIFDKDEYPRFDTTLEGLAKLPSAFKDNGTVTAGNSSGLNDAAAIVILMSAKKAKELGLKPIATIKASASIGVDPKIMGIGPISAIKKCLKKANWNTNDLDLMEINEAFAAPSIAINKEMGFDSKKVNVNGGAIALGHPIGASGARILITLLYEMIKQDAKKGLAALCIGGGMGIAMAIER